MTRNATPTHALMLAARVSGEYLTIRGRMVTLADDGSPRNLYAGNIGAVDPLCDLTITAQADRSDGGRCYAWRFGLSDGDMGPAELPQALASVATLRRAGARMDRDAASYGTAPTFGAWLARVLVALGVPAIIGATESGYYSAGQWLMLASGDAARVADDALARYYRTGEGPEYWR